MTFISIYWLSQQITQTNRARDRDTEREGRERQRFFNQCVYYCSDTIVSLPKPHSERMKWGVSSHDSKVSVCGGTACKGGRRHTKGKSVCLVLSLSVLQSSQIAGPKWRLDGVPEAQVIKVTQSSLNRWEGGKERQQPGGCVQKTELYAFVIAILESTWQNCKFPLRTL